MTKEEYSGNYRKRFSLFNVSRDTLNPELNLQNLKARLSAIEYYQAKTSAELAYWPHFLMKNVGSNIWKYKYNYLVKFFFAY